VQTVTRVLVRTFWRLGLFTCALYVDNGMFELQLVDGTQHLKLEPCTDSDDAYAKSEHWYRTAMLRIERDRSLDK
jgi:hypothetical protein